MSVFQLLRNRESDRKKCSPLLFELKCLHAMSEGRYVPNHPRSLNTDFLKVKAVVSWVIKYIRCEQDNDESRKKNSGALTGNDCKGE